jgi:Ca2+-transporting ATPase
MPFTNELDKKVSRVATLDFSSERKCMSTIVKGYEGAQNVVLLKGAPERVIEKCNSVLV